jgi:hypothetical protein
MTPENFAYWLNGFFEMTETNKLSENQVLMIKDHLKLVFDKITPDTSVSAQPSVLNIPHWDYPPPGSPRYCSPAHTCSLDTNTIGFKSTQPKCPQCPDGTIQKDSVVGLNGSYIDVHGCNRCSYNFIGHTT